MSEGTKPASGATAPATMTVAAFCADPGSAFKLARKADCVIVTKPTDETAMVISTPRHALR